MLATITDTQAQEILAGLAHPRITLEYIQSRIRHEEFIYPDGAPSLTLCLITLDNGFFALGMSAPAASQNFNQELGRKYSKENAMRDLWGKFGFALSEKIHASKIGQALPGIKVPVTPPSENAGQTTAAASPSPLSLTKSPTP